MRVRARTHHRLCRALACVVALAPVGVGGCDGDGEMTTGSATGAAQENPDPHVSFTGYVDLLDLCGIIGATHVFMRATRVGCIGSPPAPCTLPSNPYASRIGETVACPNASTANLMAVDVPSPGKYQVEAVTLTETGEQRLCFGIDGEDIVEASESEIEDRADVGVDVLTGPCSVP